MAATAQSLIVQDLLMYLLKNPMAEDCLEGIVKWWLQEKHRTREVQKAIAQLVGDSLLCVRKSTDSRIRYSMNKQKVMEIRTLLGAGGERG